MLGEDRLNAAVARKRLLTGTEKATCIFSEEGYASQTAAGNSQWSYQNIAQICETERYMIFVFPPESLSFSLSHLDFVRLAIMISPKTSLF
mgnify:CR=1 FL=1